jgi:hypothetical protein
VKKTLRELPRIRDRRSIHDHDERLAKLLSDDDAGNLEEIAKLLG